MMNVCLMSISHQHLAQSLARSTGVNILMEQMLVQEEGRNNVSGCNNGSHWRDSGREIGMTAREVN